MLPVHGTNFTLHVLPGVNISHAPQREKRIKKKTDIKMKSIGKTR